MSNLVVGTIYETIINRIVIEAQNDFEEAGLEQETLQELKQKWQSNITGMHIANCPWDPAPPPQQVANPPTLPSNVKSEGYKPEAYKGDYNKQDYKPEPNGLPIHQQHAHNGPPAEPRIKQERPDGVNMPPYQQHQGSLNPIYAQQRSQQLLQQQFGSQANASIQAQQRQNIALPQQHLQQHQQHQQHQHQQYQQHHQQQQYQQQQRPTHIQLPGQRPPQQQSHTHQQSNQGPPQTDGAEDSHAEWATMLAERRGRSDQDRLAADNAFHAYLEKAAAESDNGIMMPLSEHPSMKNNLRGKRIASSQLPKRSIVGLSTTSQSIAQFDGGDDDEDAKPKIEADEDAINSDLDDSEDELENPDQDDQEGGNVGETILCTYDKVQRVKNKWKCVLKDGILTTGGKEFVFHKATGEFEW
ncbi:transcription initiation from RNA polymerase II promoter [Venturia nashicola]|uniref:Transcription initiation from RNA polymerase II promoter n=1 Tax=Venturia nashicola TaxID=86259 RepID=A0A4Z1PKM1_9PEZI|nr:transcription initiation from RNA polymerase II promoter [Venturia nashicola]TLD38483.1 transcription initiation from RNA polymerase II promoter [Venturia nashicola]